MTDLDHLLVLWKRIHPRVERAIRNSATWLDGYPDGGPGGGGGFGGDPVGELAASHVDRGQDRAAEVRRQVERHIVALVALVDELAPSSGGREVIASKASDATPHGCCESCWRVGERVETRRTGGRLCRWCEDLARELGREVPWESLVRMRHNGQRIHQHHIDRAKRLRN